MKSPGNSRQQTTVIKKKRNRNSRAKKHPAFKFQQGTNNIMSDSKTTLRDTQATSSTRNSAATSDVVEGTTSNTTDTKATNDESLATGATGNNDDLGELTEADLAKVNLFSKICSCARSWGILVYVPLTSEL